MRDEDGCIGDDELVALVEGRLAADRAAALLAHGDGCADCLRLLAGVGRALPEEPVEDGAGEPLVRGARVGRYLVTELIGVGAMGEVHAAHDPELDRRVALKLLRAGGAGEQRRLAREAQIMARLSHPHVLPVHDAGVHGDRFFIAMELVEGQTLREWRAAAPRPWPLVVATFVEAGRGLAAAHAVGIVHRDFKPENVLLGRDGRVRVADFGLARHGADGAGPDGGIGTPAYSAPEVLAGGEATPASDQWSFCVALHEALHGTRPPAAGASLPAWLRRAVARGLAPAPADRWPGVAALVRELERHPARPWRTAALAAAALAVVATGAAVALGSGGEARACRGAGAAAAAVWTGAARARAQAAFTGGGARHAGRAFVTFAAMIDDWTRRWGDARVAACRATRVDRTQSEDVLDRRSACLDRQLDDLRAAVEVAGQPGPRLADRAPELAGGLPVAAGCDARAVLGVRVPPPPPAIAARVEAVRAQLVLGEATMRAGRAEEALPVLQRLAAEARALGYPPLEARATLLVGITLHNRHRVEEALATLTDAERLAVAAGDDGDALAALVRMVILLGLTQGKHHEALEVARSAELLGERLGDRQLLADVAYYQGIVHFEMRDAAGARPFFERALAEQRRLHGPDHIFVGFALDGLAQVAQALEDHAGARAAYDQELALFERTIGLDAPRASAPFNNRGNLLASVLRDYEGGLADLERALALAPDGSPTAGITLGNMAGALQPLGRHGEALADARRGLAFLEKGYGPDNPSTAIAHLALGDVLVELEQFPEGLEHYRRARAIDEKNNPAAVGTQTAILDSVGAEAEAGERLDDAEVEAARAALARLIAGAKPGGPTAAKGLAVFCQAMAAARRWELAGPVCAGARAATEAALPADHPDRALALQGGAAVAANAGEAGRARADLERALALLERRHGDVVLAADVRLALARLLASGEPSRARALATAARAALVASVGAGTRRVAAADRLLASLGG